MCPLALSLGVTLGATAQIIGRVAAGVASGGASEAIRYGSKKLGKATGIDSNLINAAATFGRGSVQSAAAGNVAVPGQAVELAASRLTQSTDSTATTASKTTDTIAMTEEEKQRQARLAAEKRRKEFQNLGRSSTILTGPGGLSGSGAGKGKTLLGY